MQQLIDDPTIPLPRLPCGIPNVPVWRMAVEDYHEMLQASILKDGDPVELLQGWLVPKMKKSPRHTYVASELEQQIRALLSEDWHLTLQSPITTQDSEPEPDLAIVRGGLREYRERHPQPSDVGLIIEVAHSTLEIDRGLKLQVYASAGIKEYWVANIFHERIETYTRPNSPTQRIPTGETDEIETVFGFPMLEPSSIAATYEHRRDYAIGESVPLRLNGRLLGQISVASMMSVNRKTPSP